MYKSQQNISKQSIRINKVKTDKCSRLEKGHTLRGNCEVRNETETECNKTILNEMKRNETETNKIK